MRDKEPFRSRTNAMGILLALIGGGLILLIGIYLTALQASSRGYTLAGRTGTGGGEAIDIPGWGFIAIGALFFVPAALYYLRRTLRNR